MGNGEFPPGVKRLGREADHSLPTSAKVQNTRMPPPPQVFLPWCLIKQGIRPHGVVLSKTQFHLYLTVKVKKVKLSLCLTKHHAMKTHWGVEVQLHAFLTSALDGGEWSASRPGCFTPKERSPGTHWIGGWVCPRALLDAVMKRQISSPFTLLCKLQLHVRL
jgi:hypothetical protein